MKNGYETAKSAAVYAWVIIGVLFIGLVATFGMRVSFGAYISPWETEFSVNRTVVTSISMLNFLVYAVGQPLTAKINEHFGKSVVPTASILLAGICLFLTSRVSHIWLVYILFGVGFSLGVAGCCNVIAAAVISNWFREKKGLALGLIMAGMAVGQLIMVPLNLELIGAFGWRNTMGVLGIAIMVVVTPLYVIFLRFRPEDKGYKPYGYEKSEAMNPDGAVNKAAEVPVHMPLFSVFKKKAFWQLALPYFVCGYTDVGLINTHLIPLSNGKGFPEEISALAFMLIAIANIAGSIVLGHMSDVFSRKRQLAIIYTFRAATFVLLVLLGKPGLLLLFSVLYGFVELASVAPTSSLVSELFSGISPGMIIGVVSISHQVGGAVGSWIPGILFDIAGNYTGAIVVSVVLLAASAAVVLRFPEPAKQC